jgi:glycolate oxidase FAD binding subunit
MKFSSDRLAQLLEAELGAGAVTCEPALRTAHNVDGREPALLCFPATPEQIAGALRLCSEASATVTPWGGGTAMGIGNPPRQVDAVIGLERLSLLVEHDQANLTATVQSGSTLAALQELLARHNQFLPFDPPNVARATVGGIVATNLNGPRRNYYGGVRDLVIGMKIALASGEQIKAGGKVVKNVAGYDMCKLFVGSLGTLGIITEVTLRMAPIPETAATLNSSGTLPQVQQFADELSRSKLLPSAVFLLSPKASKAKDWRAAVWCEGFEETVARHLRDALAMAQRIGLAAETLRDKAHRRLWDEICDFPLQAGRLVHRVIIPRASITEFVRTILDWHSTEFEPAIALDATLGTVWVASPANDSSAGQFAKMNALARELSGHAIVLVAPLALKEGVDVWGSPAAGLSLMREIKRQFDPRNLLNPGRFVAGI